MPTAALAATSLTLVDWAKRLDPSGKVAIIAELLSQTNEILMDARHVEGNLPTGHRVVIRTGLPTAYFRALNQGVPKSKATTVQVDEACAMIEARSEVDVDLALLNGNTPQFRLSEDTAFLEAMNQKFAYSLFYGNPALDPKDFLGFSTRYSLSTAGNGQNVMQAGGTGGGSVYTSVWLVCWGDKTVFCPFPKGSQAGLQHNDLGEQTVLDADGNAFQAYATRYQWKTGLCVKDWRYAVRICNIDLEALAAQTGTQAATAETALIKLMARAIYRLPNQTAGTSAFYMNRTVHSLLSVTALDKSSGLLDVQKGLTQFGTPHSWLSFLGIPLRISDAIINTEAEVS